MKHTFETEENKADKFFKLDNSIFDNENLSTSSDSGSEKMPELIINLKSLPDVSTVISVAGFRGKVKTVTSRVTVFRGCGDPQRR